MLFSQFKPISTLIAALLFFSLHPSLLSAHSVKEGVSFSSEVHDNPDLFDSAVKQQQTMVYGFIKVYRNDPFGELVEYGVELNEPNVLSNHKIDLLGFSGAKVRGQRNTFYFAPQSYRFQEAMVFAHANQMFRWLSKFTALEIPKVSIALADQVDGSKNAIEYVPASASANGVAQIKMTPGDGVILQNLTLDRFVISHQIAYHLIQQKVASSSSESQIVREALADAMVMLKHKNSCLGGSLCPKGSQACFVPNQCLRSAQNTLEWDKIDSSEAALKSQVLSGLIWDLHKDPGFSNTQLSLLVVKSIDFLPARARVADLIDALKIADLRLFSGEHINVINAKIRSRKLPF